MLVILGWRGAYAQVAGRDAPRFRIVVRDTLFGDQILARPTDIYRLPDGGYLVVDRSDKNLKLYQPTGELRETIGRPGGGPGEFLSLASGGRYRQRYFGFDRATNSVKWFTTSREYVSASAFGGSGRPQPYRVTPAEGELFLECGFAAGAMGRDLIALRRPDGTMVATAFPAPRALAEPAVAQFTVTLCDSKSGVVYGALSGGDAIHAFDLSGKLLDSAPILVDGDRVRSLAKIVEDNHGSIRRPDGSWAHDGMLMAIRVTAFGDNFVAVQLVKFDARRGSDVLEGGYLAILDFENGRLRPVETIPINAGLFNRSDRGAFLLRWMGAEAERVEVLELVTNR